MSPFVTQNVNTKLMKKKCEWWGGGGGVGGEEGVLGVVVTLNRVYSPKFTSFHSESLYMSMLSLLLYYYYVCSF